MTAFALSAAVRMALVGTSALSGSFGYSTAPPPPAPAPSTGTPQPFTLTSAQSGVLPFAVGYAMAQGHVPSGSSLSFTGPTAKMVVLSTWPDGSAKHGIIAGTYTSAGGTTLTVTPTVATVAAGTALTGAAVQTAMGANTAVFDAGAFGTATFSGSDFASPFKTHAATDTFIEAIYRRQIGSDAHLVAWLALRVWSSGEVEALPWIENGYLTVSGPTNKSATYSFTLGGTSRFSAAIDLPNHCRTPLLSGSALSHWLGTDPAVTAQLDRSYLQATRLVPTHSAVVSPSAAVVTSLPSTFAPLQQGSYPAGMGGAGYHGSIGVIPEWDVLYLTTTTNVSAAIQRNAYSAGRYGIHFRDESTNRPLSFASYSTLVMEQSGANGVSAVGTSSTSSYTPTSTGTVPAAYTNTHHPSMGYMAYLLTGRFYHLETLQFLATANFLKQGSATRQDSAGIFLSEAGSNTTRGMGWSLRTLAQAAGITPDSDALATQFRNSLTSNINYLHARYVDQTNTPFGHVQPYTDYTQPVVATTDTGTTTSSIVFPSGYVFTSDGYYTGWEVVINGQTRTITGYVGATRTATVSPAFSVTVTAQAFELRNDNVLMEAGWMQDFVTAALGYALAMPANLGSTVLTKLQELFFWKAQSIVGRFGTAGLGDYLYRDAATYNIAVAPSNFPNFTTGAGPWFPSWGALYDSTFLISGSPGSRVDGDLRGGNFPAATSYWGNLQPALAYAVEHGVPGASVGRARMTGASNWSSFVSSANLDPVWSNAPAIDPLATPAWRSAMSAWQWTELASADLSAVGPSSPPGSSFGVDGVHYVGGQKSSRVDAWCGMTVMGSKVTMAGVGGHTDWGGNEGYVCDLAAASPAWAQVGSPSADADMRIDVTHYLDGRPTSSHTYYSLHADQRREKIFRMGLASAYGSGNFQRQNVDAFSLRANDWDAAGAWPQVPEGLVYAKAQCQDPVTGNIYVCGNTRIWRFNLAAGTWTQLALIPNNGSAVYYRSSVFDLARNRIVVLGDEYRPTTGILVYDVATDAWSTANLTGSDATAVASQSGDFAHYNPTLDKYLYFQGASTVIEIDPTTWATSSRSTTGGGSMLNSINGVFQKVAYVPSMRGYAYQVQGNSKLWFLASE